MTARLYIYVCARHRVSSMIIIFVVVLLWNIFRVQNTHIILKAEEISIDEPWRLAERLAEKHSIMKIDFLSHG